MINKALCGALTALILGIVPMQQADACTRAVYLGPNGTIITGRSMDWGGTLARKQRWRRYNATLAMVLGQYYSGKSDERNYLNCYASLL